MQTESVAAASLIGGRVVEVGVAAGDRVRRGALIVRLDRSQLVAQEAQAQADARQAAARLAELRNGNVPSDVARAQAESRQAEASYREASAQRQPQTSAAAAEVRDAEAALAEAQAAQRLTAVTFARRRSLAATGDISAESVDQARSENAGAVARVASARQRLDRARANYASVVGAQLPGAEDAAREAAAARAAAYATVRNGTRSEQIAQAGAAYDAAVSARDYARAKLAETDVLSPADGVVASFDLHPGDVLSPNQTAAIVDSFADPYVYLYAAQRDLAALANGTRLRVVSDAGGKTYDAVVVARDRTAQFTPQNTQTADERAQLVYGVKLRIRDSEHTLLSGTTVTVDAP